MRSKKLGKTLYKTVIKLMYVFVKTYQRQWQFFSRVPCSRVAQSLNFQYLTPQKIVILKFNNEIDSQVYRLCDHGGSRGLKFKEIL